jgi:GNAT superfamily N-acetyltransferase
MFIMITPRSDRLGEGREVPLTIFRTHEPTIQLAEFAQPIGLRAWSHRLGPRRSEADVRHSFDPDRPESAELLLERMQKNAGQFVGVIAVLDERSVIGYAWAATDKSAGRVKQLAKKVSHQNTEPWAKVGQINTLPEFQNWGVGSVMLGAVTEPFARTNRRVTYVFGENGEALEWFDKRGFNKPRPKNPDLVDRYFPPRPDGTIDPVEQWRIEAPGGTGGTRAGQPAPPVFELVDIPNPPSDPVV